MNDSDLDFVDLCSKLLKRVRKKPDEPRRPRKDENQSSSQAVDRDKSKGKHRKDGRDNKVAATQPVGSIGDQMKTSGPECGDDHDAAATSSLAVSGGQRAKDKVLDRMQQFKRNSPQKMLKHATQPPRNGEDNLLSTQHRIADIQTSSSDLQKAPSEESDEALALRLQQQLDEESAQAQIVDLEDRGLFFCQICHKELSHMTPEGRTQHINRCLDESEDSTPAPAPAPAPSSGVPDCPICGKKFKSQKSRSAHLKRCSSDMGVPPAVLLQALQRQAEEGPSVASTNENTQTSGTKRKGPSKAGHPARKKPRKKQEPLDEETMVALALSSSLQEQEVERRGGKEAERLLQIESVASHSGRAPVLKWQQEAGKGRGKRKKGGVPLPPPLLLVQDAEAALARLQERVSALLLRSRAPSPPTPTRLPSTLPGWKGAAPLWQRSSQLNQASADPLEFYSPELRRFFTTSGSVVSEDTLDNNPGSSVQRVTAGTPSCGTEASIQPSPSTPGTEQIVVGSQALRDLMELAEDGMTLTQCGYDGKGQQVGAGQTANLRLSGFVQEDEEKDEEEAELCASGFLPESELRHSAARSRGPKATDQRRASRESHRSASLSKLASDLSGMVNNPHLSDVQLQVDSGEVFFAHSFMMYARCPLLVEMVHESGFGVQEEGLPAAKRVLISDVPDEAVLALLQYLYTGHSAIPASLQPHVLELASRFDLQELQQLCQAAPLHDDQTENVYKQTDQAFMELLRSMWVEGGEEEDDGADSDGGRNERRRGEEDGRAGDDAADGGETSEERVNEKELEEIYEFAATQRKKAEEEESEVEGEEEAEQRVQVEEDGGDSVFTRLQPDSQRQPSLDRSLDRLFSASYGVYENGDSATPEIRPPQPEEQPPPDDKPSPELSCGNLLHSSTDFSFSPPPSSSRLPVPGLSPVPDARGCGGEREDAVEQDEPVNRDSIGSGSPKKQPEPELIVLSDSSEDEEAAVAVLSSRSPSPPSPLVLRDPQSDAEVKSLPTPPPVANKESADATSSPGDPPDCSPEVSWLIPSTPLQPRRSTTSSSTQTQSSMCRTRLFPKVQTSPPPPPPCAFSPPASPLCKSSSAGLVRNKPRNASPTENSEDEDAPSQTKRSHISNFANSHSLPAPFKQNPPHSSTPLHPERQKSPVLMPDSPLQSHRGKKDTGDGETEVKEGETREAEESSFQHSFMDEPPIAFNDSWGLDACADANPARFSLRLEDSGPPDRSSSSSTVSHPAPPNHTGRSPNSRDNAAAPSPPQDAGSEPSRSSEPKPGPSFRSSQPDPNTDEFEKDLFDSKIWDSWEEEEEVLPLSQRVNPSAQLKTPNSSRSKRRQSLVPITPMPHYSDMDTPELKNKLNRFGVRPLPKRQMILKLKEIHQYTHQLVSSDSEDEAQRNPPPRRAAEFKEPPPPPPEEVEDGEEEPLSASQGSNTSSTAESERSNPELCVSSEGDSDSDGGISSSQAATRLRDRLLAVRSFILSDEELYSRILHYEPLVLSQLQKQLKAAGIRLGASKLIDYLDSQCITFTTAKPGHKRGRRVRAAKKGGVRSKKVASTML
ncbi:unnamed protein product [Ophioblennius macclurei]